MKITTAVDALVNFDLIDHRAVLHRVAEIDITALQEAIDTYDGDVPLNYDGDGGCDGEVQIGGEEASNDELLLEIATQYLGEREVNRVEIKALSEALMEHPKLTKNPAMEEFMRKAKFRSPEVLSCQFKVLGPRCECVNVCARASLEPKPKTSWIVSSARMFASADATTEYATRDEALKAAMAVCVNGVYASIREVTT